MTSEQHFQNVWDPPLLPFMYTRCCPWPAPGAAGKSLGAGVLRELQHKLLTSGSVVDTASASILDEPLLICLWKAQTRRNLGAGLDRHDFDYAEDLVTGGGCTSHERKMFQDSIAC